MGMVEDEEKNKRYELIFKFRGDEDKDTGGLDQKKDTLSQDAGNTYRKAGRKLRDFTPDQFCIIHLYLNENIIFFLSRGHYC